MFTEPHDVPDASNGRVSPLPIKYSRAEGRNSQDQPLRLPDGLSKPGTEANTSPTSSIHNKDARESNGHMSLPSSFEQAMMATYSYDTNMPPITPRNDPRDGMQSPKSAASSNRTPTQADFENGILGRDLPPPPSPLSASKDIISPRPQVRSELPALSRRTSRELPMPSSSGGSAASESPHKSTFVNYGESNTLSILQDKSKLPTTTPERRLLSHLDLGQSNSAAPLRTSEDSEGTFHTADSGAEIQMRPADPAETSHHTNLLAQGNESFSSGHSLNRSMHTPSETTYLPQDTQTSRRSRPFSFISFGQLGAEDLALRGPSMDSDLEKAYNDLPITPVSPLPPMPNQQSHVGPIYHGTNYDFSWDKNQSVGRPRPRSFSRPFQDPILGQHPAFRQDDPRADDADPPGDYYSPQLRRDEAIIPQTTEYQLDGIGPPPPETSTKPRSRQGSRSSAFFKRLSIPPREEVPPIPNAKEQQSMESPSTSPIKPEQKRKRASLFRSLTGHTGSDSSPSRNNSVTPSAKPRTDTQQYASPAPSGREGHRSFTSPPASSNSDKSRSKFQRASMSGVPDQEKGKKKRFSALGVRSPRYIASTAAKSLQSLFGRASPKQQPTPLLTAQPAPLRSPPQRQADVDQRQADTHYRPPGSISHPRQGSAYYTNHQDYSQPSPPAGYDQLPVGYDRPPLEGYYSPDRNSGFLQPGQISRERSPSSAMHTPHHSGSFLQSPSNHAPSLEQPQSAWVPKSMSHSAAPEMQPSTDHRNNNQSLTDPRGHGNFDSPAIVDASQSYQRFQNSQIPPKTRHNQSQSDRSHGISANTARVNAVMSGPRTYHEAPVERRDSPPPPPPPPKDDHLVQTLQSCHGRSSSQSAQSTQHSPSTSRQGVAQARQSLPPLKTNIAQTKSSSNSTPMTPEDIRKARQQQIEQSGRSPQKYVVNSSQPVRDEKIVMSSSSYPGQEWQPDFGHWNGD
ncbi:Serine/arginine repetitive matrix protein 2 [Lambiella insularis]|nr:Serine/arginine repetitive matrix protein 2 [Lambiella insularis]